MALIVWLPLNGNLNNQGLDGDITVTNSGATVDNNGKIGKCYSFTTSQYIELSNLPFSSLTHCSISFWIKVTGKGSSGWLPFTGQSTSYYLLATSAGTGAFYNSTNNVGTNGKFYIDGVKGTTPAAMNEWHHYVVTDVNLSTWTKFYINKYSAAWNFTGSVNDVRIYDHCLSKKEVKEISQGLVLHYKLDDEYIETTINISKQVNCSGWNNSGTSSLVNNDSSLFNLPYPNTKNCSITQTTDGQSAITFGTTLFNVPSKTLTASVWFYMTGNITSVIAPYIRSSKTDGNIGNLEYNGSTAISTWPKDTWIRLTKTFTTNSEATTVYFCAYVAKTGCKFAFNGWQIEENDHATPFTSSKRGLQTQYDKTIYIESDGTYWARIVHHNNPTGGVFTSSSLSWSNGVYIDANRWFDVYGTVQQLHRFEFMIKQKTTSDASETKYRWIQKKSPLTATWYDVNKTEVTRITTSGYTNGGFGGLYIINNSQTYMCIANDVINNWFGAIGCWTIWNDGIPGYPESVITSGYMDLYVRIDDILPLIYDSSGYSNDAIITDTLSLDTDTLRYCYSTKFTSNSYLRCLNRPTNCLPKDAITVNLWIKYTTWGNPISCTEGGGWNFENISAGIQFPLYISGVGYKTANSGVTPSTLINGWHMLTGTFDKTNVKIYIDGILKGTTATQSTNDIGYANNYLFIGAEAAGNTITPASKAFVGNISDVRIYSTALSQKDITDLYVTSSYIDKSGNFHCYSANEIENTQPKVRKNGCANVDNFIELGDRTKVLSDGSVWIQLLHHNNPASNLFTQSNCWKYDDGTNLYSNLYLIRDTSWANENGEYEFLVCEKLESSSTEAQYRWKQTSNPVTSSTCTGYSLISGSPGRNIGLMNKGTYAAMHNGNSWWCACGSWSDYGGGIPGFGGKVKSGYIDLYIRVNTPKIKGALENLTFFYKNSILNHQLLEI